jgi:hypothetical protein
MRALFFLLLLANLVFFGWHAGYLGGSTESAGEAVRLTQQITPEKIRIISADEAKKLAGAKPDAAAKPAATACLEWGSFTAQDFERAQVLLAAMTPAPVFTSRKVDETAGWWVSIPPQPNKAAAERKGAELKQLGVTEFFVINDEGPNKFAISLGVFKTEESAKNYLESLVKKGVKSARAAERETKVGKTIATFRDVDEALKAKLAELKKEFAGQELKECAAEEKKADAEGDAKAAEKKG